MLSWQLTFAKHYSDAARKKLLILSIAEMQKSEALLRRGADNLTHHPIDILHVDSGKYHYLSLDLTSGESVTMTECAICMLPTESNYTPGIQSIYKD